MHVMTLPDFIGSALIFCNRLTLKLSISYFIILAETPILQLVVNDYLHPSSHTGHISSAVPLHQFHTIHFRISLISD